KALKSATTKKEKHRILHNLGNALMKQKNYQQAVEAYKNALRNNPYDDETRYNYALAKQMLKDNQQNNDNQQDDQKNQDKQDQNQDKKDNKDNQQDKQDKKEDNQPKDPEQQKQDQQKQQMDNMLQALDNHEKEVRKRVR